MRGAVGSGAGRCDAFWHREEGAEARVCLRKLGWQVRRCVTRRAVHATCASLGTACREAVGVSSAVLEAATSRALTAADVGKAVGALGGEGLQLDGEVDVSGLRLDHGEGAFRGGCLPAPLPRPLPTTHLARQRAARVRHEHGRGGAAAPRLRPVPRGARGPPWTAGLHHRVRGPAAEVFRLPPPQSRAAW